MNVPNFLTGLRIVAVPVFVVLFVYGRLGAALCQHCFDLGWIKRGKDSRAVVFTQAGIEGFQGRARFVGPTTVAVGNDPLEGRHVLIATGAVPAALPFPGAAHLTTSDQFLELEALPAPLICVGGGYICLNSRI